jgi:hypothetical protein
MSKKQDLLLLLITHHPSLITSYHPSLLSPPTIVPRGGIN